MKFGDLELISFEKFSDLEIGDVIWNKKEQQSFIVTSVHENFAFVIKTIQVNNTDEWEIIKRSRIHSNLRKENK